MAKTKSIEIRCLHCKIKKALLVAVLCALSFACGGDSSPTCPTPPAPPPAPTSGTLTGRLYLSGCQTNNTANVGFHNSSAATTQDVIWDGVRVATLAPGKTSDTRVVVAGVAHDMQFRIANTATLACSTSSPTLRQCSAWLFTCAGP